MKVLAVAMLAVMWAACGDGSDGSSSDAVAKCQAYESAVCDHLVTMCSQGTRAECETSFRQSVDCGTAVQVSDSFDRCLMDLKAQACTADGPPASCKAVIGTAAK